MNNLTKINNNNQESTFDQIRRFTENGQEYWLARELMELLGYKQWRRFAYVIDTAKENLEIVTDKLVNHFLPLETKIKNSTNTKGAGRKGLDYQLSRLAAYHVALSCDSRGKENVKKAKHYFAVKTREAEVIIPAQDVELEKLRMHNENLKLQVEANRLAVEARQLDSAMLTLHGAATVLTLRGKADQLVEVEKPTIEVIDERHDIKYSGQTLVQIKNYLNTTYGFNIKSGKEVERILEAIGESGAIGSIPRTILAKYIPEENLHETMPKIVRYLSENRQLLIGLE